MKVNSLPESFEIDVSDVNVLEIVYSAKDGRNGIATIFYAMLSTK